jgi:inner membrane protein
MATPVGHLLAGQIAFRAATGTSPAGTLRLGILSAFAAVAADLDFIPGVMLGRPALYHQGASHSLIAAVVVGGILAAFHTWRGGPFLRAWIAIAIAYASHLLLDMFGPDRRAPYGIPLFWPFDSATYLSPIALLPGVSHAGSTDVVTGDWAARTFRVRNLVAALREAAILLPPVVLTEILVRRARAARSASKT